ncbi:MAG: DNA polymerase III subunit delta [Streptococcaceae bacterium]|jgi:DNA polymerase-3 subunit delta|nr:DNA polymerase III subunit delta [Streptococcaceae bacterium]
MTVFDTLASLSATALPQITLISGENEEIISELKAQLLKKVNFDSTDLSQAYFDLTETAADVALEELESLPFFGDEMLVVFENLWELTTAKKSVWTESQLSRLENFIDNPLQSTKLILVLHGKLDGKRRIVKKLKKSAFSLDAQDLKPIELRKYFMADSGLKADVLDLIIEKSNANFAIIRQNIDMVKTYAKGKTLTLEDVHAAVPKSLADNIFDLTDLILQGQLTAARALVADLVLQGEDEIKILAILSNNFRLYYLIKLLLAKKYNNQQVIQFLKLNPYRFKFLIGPARAKSQAFLAYAMQQLIDTDYQIKSGQGNKSFLLDLVLIRLSEGKVAIS